MDKSAISAVVEATGGDLDGDTAFLTQIGAASPGNNRGGGGPGGGVNRDKGDIADAKDVPQFPPRHFVSDDDDDDDDGSDNSSDSDEHCSDECINDDDDDDDVMVTVSVYFHRRTHLSYRIASPHLRIATESHVCVFAMGMATIPLAGLAFSAIRGITRAQTEI